MSHEDFEETGLQKEVEEVDLQKREDFEETGFQKEVEKTSSHKKEGETDDPSTLLRQLREECAQIYELSGEEQGLIHQLCDMMSEVQSFFKMGVAISPDIFPSTSKIEQAMLSVSGDILLVKPEMIESRPLSTFDSITVVAVLKEVADSITKYAKTFRSDITERINLMDVLVRELKRLHDLNKLHSEEGTPDQFAIPEISSEDLDSKV